MPATVRRCRPSRPATRAVAARPVIAAGTATCLAAAAIAAASGPTSPATPAPPSASPPALADAAPDSRANWFDDPFLAVTGGQPDCPVPEGPVTTAAEARAESHGRVERGTSCFRDGRCRLPNAYLYDREIAPRVVRAIAADGGFADTSVWIVVQRRWVWLQGCVSRAGQAAALEQLVRRLDDVEQVVPQLVAGPGPWSSADLPYPTRPR